MKPTRASLLLPLVMVVLAACGGDNLPMSTFEAHSDLTRGINEIYGRIFWWTLLLFILVQGGLIYAVMRFRATGKETTNPEQVHGNLRLELTWTILPVFILLHIAIPTVSTIFESQGPATADAVKINALGEQWWFAFEYPDLGVVTANEMHVPLGQEVDVRLQSDNVIHSFWVPQLAAKRDMMPGRVNRIKFKAEKLGEYHGQCAEYCGDSHALMKFRVVVDTPEDFAKWVAAQKAPADTEAATAKAGFDAFQNAGCVACHSIRGTTAAAVIGPDLTHVGSRTMIASGILENNAENLKKWIMDPTEVKPGSKMTDLNLSDEQAASITAYLQTLK